jgi:glycosyltransferase involved in cell wall biosynthesis
MNGTTRAVIVVPCFNEARRLRSEAFTEFAARHADIGFLFVNDGSSDETLPLLQRLAAGAPGSVEVLDLPVNRGKAEAVRQGVQAALRFEPAYVGFWDADLATPLAEIPELIAVMQRDPAVEMVFGSRVRLMGRTIERLAWRHYAGRVFATVVSLLLRLAIYDTQCGAKLFRVTPDVVALFERPFLSRWIFDVEIIARRLHALRGPDGPSPESLIVEYPLREWRDRPGSKLVPLDFVTAAGELARIGSHYRPWRHASWSRTMASASPAPIGGTTQRDHELRRPS